MSRLVIVLPWGTPPLNANQRMHWRQKAAVVASVRRDTALLVRSANVPRGLAHVDVSLHYAPRDARRRDADNLVPTLKACCDGIVDAHIVADDTPAEMTKHMPVIHPKTGTGVGRLWLTIDTQEKP